MPPKRLPRTLNIREWDISLIEPNSRIALIGMSGSGKSSIIDAILYHWAYLYPVYKVFSGTETENHFYEGDDPHNPKIPGYYIYDELDENEIIKFIKRARLVTNLHQKNNSINPYSALICDDVSDDSQLLNKRIFKQIMKKSRHWSTLFMFAMQYPADLKPTLRGNFNYVFIMKEDVEKSKRSIHENYATVISDYRDFEDILSQITEDYTALVIDKNNKTNKLEDCIFFYKAPYPIPHYQCGCTEFREKAKKEHNYKYDAVDEILDAPVPKKK